MGLFGFLRQLVMVLARAWSAALLWPGLSRCWHRCWFGYSVAAPNNYSVVRPNNLGSRRQLTASGRLATVSVNIRQYRLRRLRAGRYWRVTEVCGHRCASYALGGGPGRPRYHELVLDLVPRLGDLASS